MTRRPGPFLLVGLLALVSVVAACSTPDDDDPVTAGSVPTTTASTLPPGQPPGGEGQPPAPDGPSPPSGPATSAGAPTTVGTTTTAPAGEPPPPAPPPVDDDGGLGSMAVALLSPAIPAATVEVDTTEGLDLTSSARQGLVDALRVHGNKRSIGFAGASTVPASGVYSAADLRRLAATHRATRSNGRAVSVYVLLLEGEFETPGVTGVAFGASSMAVFPDTLGGGLLSATSYPQFERSVVVHEVGHLFGLVDLTGHGAFHEDPDHPGHSVSRASVMYWAVEDVSIANLFRGGPPTDFDGDDRREMELIRAGA